MTRKLLAITAFVALAFVPALWAQDNAKGRPLPELPNAPKPVREYVRPEGLTGAILLCPDAIPDAAIERFVELAGKEKANIVLVISSKKADRATVEKLAETWKKKSIASVAIIPAERDSPGARETLPKATGVWLLDPPVKSVTFEVALPGILGRGGVIGAPASVARRLTFLTAATAELLSWMRDFGIAVSDDATLIVRGRETTVLGNGSATVHLRKSATLPERTIRITAKSPSDLTWLRRCALARAAEPFPPKVAPVPEVPKGSLVIVGGGGLPPDVTKKFIDLSGGPDALIVVLPTAQPDPLKPDAEAGFLRKTRAKNVVVIPGRKLEDVEDPKNLELVAKAGGVWFGGGRQWRFVDAYENTKMHEAFREVLKRGGVIGGSSAGATIQGDYLCRGSPFNNTDIMCEGYERGLGFLPGVAIDQHFAQRKRFADMTLLMKTYPQLLGIGLDEGTAIIVSGHIADVMGKSEVHFYDRKKPVEKDKPDHESIKAGGRYDLKERKALPSEP